MGLQSTVAAWAGLTVRTGERSFAAVHGASVWDGFTSHPEVERLFAASMRQVTEINAPADP